MARKKWEDMSTNDLDALYDKCKDYYYENEKLLDGNTIKFRIKKLFDLYEHRRISEQSAERP